MKNKVVLFRNHTAEVLINPPHLESYRDREDAVINPCVKRVRGVPPHYWVRSGDLILEMNAVQKALRDLEIEGVNQALAEKKLFQGKGIKRVKWTWVTLIFIQLLLVALELGWIIYGHLWVMG